MGILSMLPSLNKIIAGLGAAYLCNTLYSLYVLYHPKLCTEASTKCLPSALARKGDDLYMDRFQLRVYTYTPSMSHFALILKREGLSLTDDEFSSTVAITIPKSVSVHNGSLLCAAYLMPDSCAADDLQPESGCKWFVRRDAELTKYALPTPDAYSLLGEAKEPEREIQSETNDESVADQPVVHLRSLIPLTAVAEPHSFDFYQVPREIAPLLKLTYNSKTYYPLFYMDHVSFRMRDLLKIPPKVKTMNVTVSLKRVTIGKLIMLVNAFNSMHQLKNLGFSDKDCDEVTGIFTDTSFLLLMTTVCVSTIHLILDILAFKNDIHFWRKRKTMVGLSRRTLIWRCFSNTIISAYLYDTGASLLVLAPAMFGTLVEYWKVTKALKVHVSWPSGSRTPRVTFGDSSEAELETEAFDSQGMSYLAVLMTPLCIAGAIYSLVYEPHKSWYSWCVQSLANGVYAFGFLFMLPQLFVNYKLKSVAHLPWRAFVYKAVNTFIDDLFAFIIHMPTAHRLACFRDDVVFVVYLVQLYLYPVDWSRVNEYGESFENDKSDKKDKTD